MKYAQVEYSKRWEQPKHVAVVVYDPENDDDFMVLLRADSLVVAEPYCDEVNRKIAAYVNAARREGAEAMREAAARIFDEDARAWGDRLGGVIPKENAARIRALPLPGDKP